MIETRQLFEGVKEINILPTEGFYKTQTEKNVLVAKPDGFWTEDRPSFRSLAVTLGAEGWPIPAAPEVGTDWERLALAA